MTWFEIITPIPKTLIPDDERRRGVNRGFLIAAALILLFLFIYWLFKDLAGIADAKEHPFLLALLELAKVLAGVIVYLAACWGFKACVHIITQKSEKSAPASPPEVHVEISPEMDRQVWSTNMQADYAGGREESGRSELIREIVKETMVTMLTTLFSEGSRRYEDEEIMEQGRRR